MESEERTFHILAQKEALSAFHFVSGIVIATTQEREFFCSLME